MEQAKDRIDFGRRALPVGGRDGEQGERVDAQLGSSFNDGTAGFRSRAMARGAPQATRSGPAAVAIGNDGDMQHGRRKRRRSIEDVLQDNVLNGHDDVSSPPRENIANNFV